MEVSYRTFSVKGLKFLTWQCNKARCYDNLARKSAITSSSSGNCPVLNLENMGKLSKSTSKIPPAPATSSAVKSSSSLILAAKLAAFGS